MRRVTLLLCFAGAIRWIHSGFSGPGTGRAYGDLVDGMERRIGQLLAE